MTPFLYQNVPPPMSAMVVNTDENIQEIAFSSSPSGTQMAVLGTSRSKVTFYELPANARGHATVLGTLELRYLERTEMDGQLAVILTMQLQ